MLLHTLSCTIILCTPGNLPAGAADRSKSVSGGRSTGIKSLQSLHQNQHQARVRQECHESCSKNNHFSPSCLHFVGLFSMPKSYQVRLCLRINITILLELVCLKNYSMTCCLRAKLTSMPGIGLVFKTTKPYVRTHI